MKISSFFHHLYPLAVLYTGALSGSKLKEHVCAYSRLDFVLSEVLFLLLPFYALTVVNWCTLSW